MCRVVSILCRSVGSLWRHGRETVASFFCGCFSLSRAGRPENEVLVVSFNEDNLKLYCNKSCWVLCGNWKACPTCFWIILGNFVVNLKYFLSLQKPCTATTSCSTRRREPSWRPTPTSRLKSSTRYADVIHSTPTCPSPTTSCSLAADPARVRGDEAQQERHRTRARVLRVRRPEDHPGLHRRWVSWRLVPSRRATPSRENVFAIGILRSCDTNNFFYPVFVFPLRVGSRAVQFGFTRSSQ